jgi:hypothetical protein
VQVIDSIDLFLLFLLFLPFRAYTYVRARPFHKQVGTVGTVGTLLLNQPVRSVPTCVPTCCMVGTSLPTWLWRLQHAPLTPAPVGSFPAVHRPRVNRLHGRASLRG